MVVGWIFVHHEFESKFQNQFNILAVACALTSHMGGWTLWMIDEYGMIYLHPIAIKHFVGG